MCLGIVDSDILMYRSASAAQHVHYNVYPHQFEEQPEKCTEEFRIGEEFASSKDMKEYLKGIGKTKEDFFIQTRLEVKPVFQAKLILDQMVDRIIKDTGCSEMVFFLSDKTNFRHRLAVTTPYKVRDNEKPVHYAAVKEYLMSKYRAVIVEDLEADDALAEWAELCNDNGQPCVIISDDKDLHQIPGLHYNVRTNQMKSVTVDQSLRLFFRQVLMGDPTDSIPGLPGIGIKTADKHINPCRNMKEMIDKTIEVYKANKKLDVPDRMKYLNEQANLIYLRRKSTEGIQI